MLNLLSDLRDTRFSLRRTITDRINESIGENIRVTICKNGGTGKYKKLLEESLRDASVKQGAVSTKIAETVPPWDLAELICDGNDNELRERTGLNKDQACNVVEALSFGDKLFAIEAATVSDLTKIELKDGEEWKESENLSTGQKCTAILPILLLESEKPLLIDQPEDNLDNRFIFTNVVERIRAVKKTRQLIFVTHNPNIPVLGEAERVFVLESDGVSARKKAEGTVDDCRGDIIDLLEGGAEAFEERRRRYGLSDERR